MWGSVIVSHAVGMIRFYRLRHLPLIGFREPKSLMLTVVTFWVTLGVDQFLAVVEPLWFCRWPWIQPINGGALMTIFCLCVWRYA